jgi:hypothetical protein
MCLTRKVVTLVLPVAFLVACKDQATAPSAPLQQTHTIAADYTNNPDGGGPNLLYRGVDGWSFTAVNDRYIVAFFPDPLSRCGHDFPLAQSQVSQYKGDINSFYHWVGHGRAMNVYVIDTSEPATCTVPLGSGSLVGWSENGQVATVGDNETWTGEVPVVPDYADSYRDNGKATLTTPAGGTAHVAVELHCVWTPNLPLDAPYRCQTHIKVTN